MREKWICKDHGVKNNICFIGDLGLVIRKFEKINTIFLLFLVTYEGGGRGRSQYKAL